LKYGTNIYFLKKAAVFVKIGFVSISFSCHNIFLVCCCLTKYFHFFYEFSQNG